MSTQSDEQLGASPAPGETGPILGSPSIMLSRQRCRMRRLNPDTARPRLVHVEVDSDATHLSLARPVLEDVYQFIEGSGCVLGFADAEARLLDSMGDAALADELRACGWQVGAQWSEECTGTNALALALLDAFPVQVCGSAHYARILQPYCTSAAPIYDSVGELVGAVVAVTRAENAHPHTLAMISAAAGALTNELTTHLWLGSANEFLTELNAILHSLSEGIVLLQPDGTIKQMNARAGHLLGLAPARVAGRRLADVARMPQPLAEALDTGREFHDEELVFHVGGERVACVCSLRAIVPPMAYPLARTPAIWKQGPRGPRRATPLPFAGIQVSPTPAGTEYVLTLRSAERVQRLVHRISGAEARMRFENIVGQSPKLLEAVRLAHIAAESSSTVLLHGETGTGKEIFAQSIHAGSGRAQGPFVAINCAAIPRELISSELFGYEGGSFTGADRQGRPGKFELAHGGTLFLDEIGDMPLDLQTSLLRAIETRSIVRIGGRNVIPVDVRIIAATHRDLNEAVQLGHFRSDLFFRLNVFPIDVPALCERPGDVPLLLRHILQRLSTRLHRSLGIEAEALAGLDAYSWPGNVRELENVIERAVYVSDSGIITLRDLPSEIRAAAGEARQQATWSQYGALGAAPRDEHAAGLSGPHNDVRRLRQESDNAESALILRTLTACNGNLTQAAHALGISRTTLWRKKQRYGI